MSKSYYNLAGIEELESGTLSSAAHIEDIAHQMQSTAGLIADGTLGSAADAHSESAHIQQQVSAKLHEVQNLIQQVTAQAKESAMQNDAHGATTLGYGG